MKDQSDETSLERLKDLLQRIDASPSGMKDVPADDEDEALRRELLSFSQALAASSPGDEPHFTLEELSGLAKERHERGDSWVMPGHLSRCPLCLETFQILLEGVPKPSDAAIERFAGIWPNKIVAFPGRWKLALKIAASIAVVLGAMFLLQHARHTSARVTDGGLALDTGRLLPHGAAIPEGVVLVARNPTSALFADGSKVDLTAHTKVTFHESFHGGATVGLQSGAVVATVAKQTKGREFVVRTPLGEVVVVGTRFRVTCAGEDVMVFQSGGSRADAQGRKDVVRAVHVTVFDGVVRVKSRSEEARVAAGQTAVLRENEPGIEVSGEEL